MAQAELCVAVLPALTRDNLGRIWKRIVHAPPTCSMPIRLQDWPSQTAHSCFCNCCFWRFGKNLRATQAGLGIDPVPPSARISSAQTRLKS